MKPVVREVRTRIVNALVRLERLFTPGMQLTFIALHPNDPEMHLIVTSSTKADLQNVLDRAELQ